MKSICSWRSITVTPDPYKYAFHNVGKASEIGEDVRSSAFNANSSMHRLLLSIEGHFDLPIDHAQRIGIDRLGSRKRAHATGCKVEARAVQRALDLAVVGVELALGQIGVSV